MHLLGICHLYTRYFCHVVLTDNYNIFNIFGFNIRLSMAHIFMKMKFQYPWYTHGIYQVYTASWNMNGIYVVYTLYLVGVPDGTGNESWYIPVHTPSHCHEGGLSLHRDTVLCTLIMRHEMSLWHKLDHWFSVGTPQHSTEHTCPHTHSIVSYSLSHSLSMTQNSILRNISVNNPYQNPNEYVELSAKWKVHNWNRPRECSSRSLSR